MPLLHTLLLCWVVLAELLPCHLSGNYSLTHIVPTFMTLLCELSLTKDLSGSALQTPPVLQQLILFPITLLLLLTSFVL